MQVASGNNAEAGFIVFYIKVPEWNLLPNAGKDDTDLTVYTK